MDMYRVDVILININDIVLKYSSSNNDNFADYSKLDFDFGFLLLIVALLSSGPV